MSAAVDANILIYAANSESELQSKARGHLAELASGPSLLYLFWPVIAAYLRIVTHRGVFRTPLSPSSACADIERLLRRPHVRAPGETRGFWSVFRTSVESDYVRGDLVSDAHLVALMRVTGVTTIWTRDRDLRKFDGIRALDPFEG